MFKKNDHIIQKQFIEIEFENLDDAMGVQNQIAELFYENLQPRMEILFDELFGKNYYASIDKLEITCGPLNKKNWKQEFTEQAMHRLKEELIQVNKKRVDIDKVEEAYAAETFFFFLKNGFLPWNKQIKAISDLEPMIIINENMVVEVKKLIIRQPGSAERLVYQFSKNFVSKIIAAIAIDNKTELSKIYSLLEKLGSFQMAEPVIDAAILKTFAADENKSREREFLTLLLAKHPESADIKLGIKKISEHLHLEDGKEAFVTGKHKQGSDEKEKKQKLSEKEKGEQQKTEKLSDAIYINNAGLVLLHPYLQTLFENVKLTEENVWIDEASQHKAVLVLAFLATGNEEFEEFNLMLNKILCGIELDETVTTKQQLDGEVQNECKILLNDVIKHWVVLKNTGIDALRETFLQRNGKLSKVDNGWLLQVEQKGVDILLNSLPWGIGTVKLPWMKELLFVEWV